METKESLTNEAISKNFDNQFELVNHAIHLARDMIQADRAPRSKAKSENPAVQVLAEILEEHDSGKSFDFEGVDGFEDDEEMEEESAND